jgi:nickel-type superoxide dismutase maturation protease
MNRRAVGLAGMIVMWRWLRPFRVAVEGRSMSPALLPGDYVIAIRPLRLRRGDLVVVEHPERPGFEMVKRLTGVPGDMAAGRLLGADEYWIRGDDPVGSTDSRSFGPVRPDAVRGVVRVRYWPPERIRVFG